MKLKRSDLQAAAQKGLISDAQAEQLWALPGRTVPGYARLQLHPYSLLSRRPDCLGYLAYHVFRDSLLFPFVLTLIGLGVIYLGILWQRHETAISTCLQTWLPAALRELIEQRQ